MTRLHDDELHLDTDLVRRLVARSFPEYAGLRVSPFASTGSTNALFRLGDDLLVRLPRQPGGSATIEKEARWLPQVAAGLTVAVPEIVAVGEPALGYPESWAVTRWVDGDPPAVPFDGVVSSRRLAEDLAVVVKELRRIPVPPEAYADPDLSWYRGGPLAAIDADVREAVEASRTIPGLGLDLDRVVEIWGRALAAERALTPMTGWYHGDLLAENLLVRGGRLAAVLDFGALSVGDPTVDLIGAWEVLDAPGRAVFKEAVGVDEATWTKAMGWALAIAVITFPYYWESMPKRCADRRAMAVAVLAEA